MNYFIGQHVLHLFTGVLSFSQLQAAMPHLVCRSGREKQTSNRHSFWVVLSRPTEVMGVVIGANMILMLIEARISAPQRCARVGARCRMPLLPGHYSQSMW